MDKRESEYDSLLEHLERAAAAARYAAYDAHPHDAYVLIRIADEAADMRRQAVRLPDHMAEAK